MPTARKPSEAKQRPVVVLAGVEEFLIRRELEQIVGDNVTAEARAFDFNEFRAAEVDAGTLWNALITLPFLASRRVVILHLQGEPKEELLHMLNRYAVNPSPSTLLIIVQIFEDRSGAIKLEGDVQTRAFPVQSVAKRSQWAQDYVKQNGKELPAEAAEYLVSISSSSLSDIAAKLEHAMLYSGEERVITLQAVMKLAGVTSEFMPWEVENAILERHPPKIFERARAMEAGGEELLRLIAFQRGALLRLWAIGALAKKAGIRKYDETSKDLLFGASREYLGNKVFKAGDLFEAHSAIGEENIRQAVVDLLDLEVRIKTGRANWRGYYDWIWKLIHPPRSPELPMLHKS